MELKPLVFLQILGDRTFRIEEVSEDARAHRTGNNAGWCGCLIDPGCESLR
jgi:hypothetical protein